MLASIYIYISIELLMITYGDIKYKKIPNYWSLLNIVTFVVFLFLFPAHYGLQLEVFIYSIVFFVVGFFLYYLKIMGGGDSKFLCTLFLLIPVYDQDKVFVLLLYVTIFVGVSLLMFNSIKNGRKIKEIIRLRKFADLREVYGKKFTYAPVILMTWLLYGLEARVWK